MKKVLIITYAFPPMAAVGSYRVIKACKFLPRHDWLPVILTVKKGYNCAYDYKSLEEISPEIPVYRSKFISPLMWYDLKTMPSGPSRAVSADQQTGSTGGQKKLPLSAKIKKFLRELLSIPDIFNFWIPLAVFKGLKAIRKEKIDIILSTSPPATTHFIGYILSKLTGKPLAIDFQDLWTQNEGYHLKDNFDFFKRVDRNWEKRIMKHAKGIISCTTGFTGVLSETNSYKSKESFHTFTLGVDRDDFADIKLPNKKNEKFEILHLGSLYGNRNPYYFFDCMKLWVKKNPDIKENVRVDFIGNAPGYEKSLVGTSIDKVVNFNKHIPQKEVFPRLWQADLLLLILGFHTGTKNTMQAKLYEYLSTGRSILAYIPDGIAAGVIRKYKAGFVARPNQFEEIVEYLEQQYRTYLNSPSKKESGFKYIEEIDYAVQNKKFAEILDTILNDKVS